MTQKASNLKSWPNKQDAALLQTVIKRVVSIQTSNTFQICLPLMLE